MTSYEDVLRYLAEHGAVMAFCETPEMRAPWAGRPNVGVALFFYARNLSGEGGAYAKNCVIIEDPEVGAVTAARIGDRVRKARDSLGWTQATLAERCGLHWCYISHIETHKREPSARNLVKLSRVLGFSADYLLGLVDERGRLT